MTRPRAARLRGFASTEIERLVVEGDVREELPDLLRLDPLAISVNLREASSEAVSRQEARAAASRALRLVCCSDGEKTGSWIFLNRLGRLTQVGSSRSDHEITGLHERDMQSIICMYPLKRTASLALSSPTMNAKKGSSVRPEFQSSVSSSLSRDVHHDIRRALRGAVLVLLVPGELLLLDVLPGDELVQLAADEAATRRR